MKSKIQHIEKIKGTYETTVKPQANPQGVDNPEESTFNLEGLDDPKESLANLEEENSDQKSEIIALKKKFAEMETDMKSKIQHIEKEVGALDGRLLQSEKRTAVCGYQGSLSFSSDTILIFERVYDEVNSGGTLQENGYFTAEVPGVYFVTLKSTVRLLNRQRLTGYLKLSSGQYGDNDEDEFIYCRHPLGGRQLDTIIEQLSASSYVKMAAGETLHIEFTPESGGVELHVYYNKMCVSLYSASG